MGKKSDKLNKALEQWKSDYKKSKSKFKKKFVCVAERDLFHRLYKIVYPALHEAKQSLPWRYSAPKVEQVLAALSHLEMLEVVFQKKKRSLGLDKRLYTKNEREALEQRFRGVKKSLDIVDLLSPLGIAAFDRAFKYPSPAFTSFLFECVCGGVVGLNKIKEKTTSKEQQDVVTCLAGFFNESAVSNILWDFGKRAFHTSCARKGNDFEYVL